MATVRNGKLTGRLQPEPQTVQEPAEEPKPQRGNRTGIDVASIYRHWTAAYRGFVPHGIRMPSPERGMIKQFDDNPETFNEDIVEEPEGIILVDPYEQTYFTTYTRNVGVLPVQLAAYEKTRVKLRVFNSGPGIVWISHNESVGTDGFPLTNATQPFELETTREVWAIQQSAQSGLAAVSVLNEYVKEVGS